MMQDIYFTATWNTLYQKNNGNVCLLRRPWELLKMLQLCLMAKCRQMNLVVNINYPEESKGFAND